MNIVYETNEYSFILSCSQHGIGVFATHNILEKTYLRLFTKEGNADSVSIARKIESVPKPFRLYCLNRGEFLMTPRDFGRMEIGWYLNHSDNPNSFHKNYDFYALRDIKEGEEITIDYNTFEEPSEARLDIDFRF